MIQNPILPGFCPDPSIIRVGEDYYIANSSFEWWPGVKIYHSRDLKHYEQLPSPLNRMSQLNMVGEGDSCGAWAPDISWDGEYFWLIYTDVKTRTGGLFNTHNYLVKSKDIRGGWSEPVYLNSSGFDPSVFHDTDGKMYIVNMINNFKGILVQEYDPEKECLVGEAKNVFPGTGRGYTEGPHIYHIGEYYYLLMAEGGTGYNHCVTMGRSKNVWGPYEKDPKNPIVTSVPGESYERQDPDHLKPKYYNPDSVLQKSGHGSYVELPTGEVYLVHLCSRPFVPELRCTLGRETAIQKMMWTEDNWLRMADGSNLAKIEVPETSLPEYPVEKTPDFDDFDGDELGNFYYSPRIMPQRFADVKARKGYVRLRGQESRTSLNKVSILARKLTSVYARITTKMEFTPEVHQHSAGLILYYDNMNYINLRKYYSETLGQSALSIIHLENGEKTEFLNTRIPVEDKPIYLRLYIEGRKSWFEWSYDGENYEKIGRIFDTTRFSDEYCKYGEFTGTMVGITCADRVLHKKCADFDFFEYIADENRMVE